MFFVIILGSGALPGKKLDLGLLKISLCVFFPFLASVGGFNPTGPYPNLFPNPAGQN